MRYSQTDLSYILTGLMYTSAPTLSITFQVAEHRPNDRGHLATSSSYKSDPTNQRRTISLQANFMHPRKLGLASEPTRQHERGRRNQHHHSHDKTDLLHRGVSH